MESSFKKAYEKQELPNGDIEISFKSSRIGVHAASNLLLALIVFFGWIPLWIGLAAIINPSEDAFGTLVVVSIIIWFVLVYFFIRKKSTIVIRPNEGIIFNNKQLPFSDISVIGVMRQTTTRDANGTSYVYAEAGGKQIKVTAHMPKPRADAICEEIKHLSGIGWN